jgi:hypothetical protein
MSKALSLDLRERVLAAIAAGVAGRQAAERFAGNLAVRVGVRSAQESTVGGLRNCCQFNQV